MNVVDLINYLRLEGPHDLECIPIASKKDAPPSRDKLTDEEGGSKEEGDDPTEVGPIEEADPKEDPSEREPMDKEDREEDPEKDPSKGGPMEGEDPEEDLEEDSEVSDG